MLFVEQTDTPQLLLWASNLWPPCIWQETSRRCTTVFSFRESSQTWGCIWMYLSQECFLIKIPLKKSTNLYQSTRSASHLSSTLTLRRTFPSWRSRICDRRLRICSKSDKILPCSSASWTLLLKEATMTLLYQPVTTKSWNLFRASWMRSHSAMAMNHNSFPAWIRTLTSKFKPSVEIQYSRLFCHRFWKRSATSLWDTQ